MKKDHYAVIGVMSGTSLDGLDLAHILFHKSNEKWTFKILESQTIPYSTTWVQRLQAAVAFSELELQQLNQDYTALLAHMINTFIVQQHIKNPDAICSHGHTILHQPQNKYTLQIGNLPQIATLTKQTVVCDFRVQDVQLGGQGAPLVPIGDALLFSDYDYCLNLGGFSNVSFTQNENRVAFDISPVNTVLNFYAHQLGLDYDDKGAIAQSGSVNEALLQQLNDLPFYSQKPPKSLGFEFVKEVVLPLIEQFKITIADKLCTFTQHIAQQTAQALNKKSGTLLLTGGGAYNTFLIAQIQNHLPQMELVVPDKKIIEFKEALIFGLLGVLKLRGEINTLASVTGAKNNHSAGRIYQKQ